MHFIFSRFTLLEYMPKNETARLVYYNYREFRKRNCNKFHPTAYIHGM